MLLYVKHQNFIVLSPIAFLAFGRTRMANEVDDDWDVECSDDDNYGFTFEGEEWLPQNEVTVV